MAKEHKKFQPDYMTDKQIDDYYNSFDWENMTDIDAKRLIDQRSAHYNSSRQKNRLLYDWLLRKLSGLSMKSKIEETS
jgi:hypothetical protein